MPELSKQPTICIAWEGLPIYACRIIRAFRERAKWASVDIVTQLEATPYASRITHLGSEFHECRSNDPRLSWATLGLAVPQCLFVSSWNNRGYNALAKEVKRSGGSVILMSDNIFHGSLKQWLGAIYFRLRLRKGYDAALVPGVRGAQFLRFLGMTQSTIRTGLYASDPAIFRDDGRQKNGECIFVGQLIERKGIRELVPAAKRLGILQRITFYGVGKLRKWMLEQGCRIQGFIQPSELGEVLRNHSILVLPSRLDHWPLAVHEGALAGCALIVSDKTGSAYDFIINQENGCVFRTGSSTSLEASMKWMLEQPSQWFDNARKLSHERAMAFTPEKCASIMEEIYRTTQNGKLK